MAKAIIPQQIAQERAAVYLLFARLFREAPSVELLRDIVQHRLLTLAEQWSEGSEPLDPAEDLRWPLQAEEIAVEYARLFAVPGKQAVHPYESAYCDTLTIDTQAACSPYFEPDPQASGLTGFLHGHSTVEVREAYRQAGFELDLENHELPDHLAIELELMGRLLERGDVDQTRTFFMEHLGRWIFRCLVEIKRKTASSFYRAVADSLASFLQREQGSLTAELQGQSVGSEEGDDS